MSDVGTGAILIAGPTASGKSALAIRLAKALGGTVINADSMQVYADLRVITARPTVEDEAEAPHRLFGHVGADVNFSVGRYVADAVKLLGECGSERLPIFVGGTGLYFKALTDGLSDMPMVPDSIRDRVRDRCAGMPTPSLHEWLRTMDPETAARLRPTDRLRIQRALEVFEATGTSLTTFQGARQPGPLSELPVIKIFLSPDRDILRQRIDQRFRTMLEMGALEEVRALSEQHLDPMLPAMRAHGVPGLLAHLRGEMTLEEAIVRGQGDTRRYAKRQFTWFRHQLADWQWVPPEDAYDAVMRSFSERLPRTTSDRM